MVTITAIVTRAHTWVYHLESKNNEREDSFVVVKIGTVCKTVIKLVEMAGFGWKIIISNVSELLLHYTCTCTLYVYICTCRISQYYFTSREEKVKGPVRDLNPGPLAP